MVCSVYDGGLNKIGIFTVFTSLVWKEAYTGSGLFQLVMPKSERAIALLQEEHFVGISDADTLMYIESVEDKDGQLWAYGTEAKYLLDARIYDGTLNLNGNVETTLRKAVQDKRPYPFLGLADSAGLTGRSRSQATYMTDTCVCCGMPVPEGRMVCSQCEYANERAVPGRKENEMDDGIQAKIAEIEQRAKSNTHRIDELEADNKALHQLATSVEVLATKQETIEENVSEIKADVKSLKALPAGRWEGLVKALVSALVGGLVAYGLFRLGLGA